MISKQLIYFTSQDDMLQHAKDNFMTLVSYKGAVYDLSEFIFAHPGGNNSIQELAHQPLDNILFNEEYHKHSPHIITKLQQYLYGYIKKVEGQNIAQHKSAKLIGANTPKKNKKVGNTLKFLREEVEAKNSSIRIDNIKKYDLWEQEEIPEDDDQKLVKLPDQTYRFKSQQNLI